jgi:mannose-6-phosphate isomerase-like protein (cupin superfamily)
MEQLKITNPKKIEKGWGYELHIINDKEHGYCGKILHFYKNAKFSMHYHIKKKETWYIASGKFLLKTFDIENGDPKEFHLKENNVINFSVGTPHQLITLEEGDIFETSTPDSKEDNYRIGKGDSQYN